MIYMWDLVSLQNQYVKCIAYVSLTIDLEVFEPIRRGSVRHIKISDQRRWRHCHCLFDIKWCKMLSNGHDKVPSLLRLEMKAKLSEFLWRVESAKYAEAGSMIPWATASSGWISRIRFLAQLPQLLAWPPGFHYMLHCWTGVAGDIGHNQRLWSEG